MYTCYVYYNINCASCPWRQIRPCIWTIHTLLKNAKLTLPCDRFRYNWMFVQPIIVTCKNLIRKSFAVIRGPGIRHLRSGERERTGNEWELSCQHAACYQENADRTSYTKSDLRGLQRRTSKVQMPILSSKVVSIAQFYFCVVCVPVGYTGLHFWSEPRSAAAAQLLWLSPTYPS